MADATTDDHGFTLPEVTASDETWGTKLNANWTLLDGKLFDKTAGDTITGAVTIEGEFTVDSTDPITMTGGDSDGFRVIGESDEVKMKLYLAAGSSRLDLYGIDTEVSTLKVGYGRDDNGAAQVDFVTAASGDYHSRIRRSAGASGALEIMNSGSGNVTIESEGIGDIIFKTNNDSVMYIQPDGDVGIQVDPALDTLHVGGTFRAEGIYTTTTASAANVVVASNGQLRLSTSSRAHKKNIKRIAKEKCDGILSIEPVEYYSKAPNDNPTQVFYSLVAEDVHRVNPSFASVDDYGVPNGLNLNALVAALIGKIQEHEERIAALEAS